MRFTLQNEISLYCGLRIYPSALHHNFCTICCVCDIVVLFHTFVTQVELLKNKFGFDEAFNYKEEADLDAALKRLVVVFYFLD